MIKFFAHRHPLILQAVLLNKGLKKGMKVNKFPSELSPI